MPSAEKVQGELTLHVSLPPSLFPSSLKEELVLVPSSTRSQGRDETPVEREQRKSPALVKGQPRHHHNHQHQKGFWKRQALPRPVQAALQLWRPSPRPSRARAGCKVGRSQGGRATGSVCWFLSQGPGLGHPQHPNSRCAWAGSSQ